MRVTVKRINATLIWVLIVAAILASLITIDLIKFSSPSSDCGASLERDASHDYFHTIPEMQRWCGADDDGEWGTQTDRLYRLALIMQEVNRLAALFHSEDANDIQIFGSSSMGRYIDGIK